jgi:hypothetical protein
MLFTKGDKPPSIVCHMGAWIGDKKASRRICNHSAIVEPEQVVQHEEAALLALDGHEAEHLAELERLVRVVDLLLEVGHDDELNGRLISKEKEKNNSFSEEG